MVPARAYTANDLVFSRDGLGSCKLTTWHGRPFHSLKFSRGNPGIKVAANLGIGDGAHAAPESVTNQCPLIDDCLPLKILVARKGKRFPCAVERIGRLLLLLDSLACRAHDRVGLVAEVGSELAMRSHHFAGRMNLLLVAGRVGRDLSSLLAVPTGALQVLANLLTARAGRIQIFLAISLNLRGAASTNGNFVSQLPQSIGQFRLIDGCGKLLRIEEALRLDGAWLTILALE